MLYEEQMIDPLSNQYQILWSYVRFRILNGRKYGNTNVADYNLLNNKMSQESDKYLVDVAPGGGEPRTFASVSFHGSVLFYFLVWLV